MVPTKKNGTTNARLKKTFVLLLERFVTLVFVVFLFLGLDALGDRVLAFRGSLLVDFDFFLLSGMPIDIDD